jgi:hypothetical protein
MVASIHVLCFLLLGAHNLTLSLLAYVDEVSCVQVVLAAAMAVPFSTVVFSPLLAPNYRGENSIPPSYGIEDAALCQTTSAMGSIATCAATVDSLEPTVYSNPRPLLNWLALNDKLWRVIGGCIVFYINAH